MDSRAFTPLSLALLIVALAAPARAQNPARADDADVPTAPVEIDGSTLFRVRGVSSYSAEARAQLIEGRILAVAADASIPSDAVHVADRGAVSMIAAGEQPLMGVIDADSTLEGVTRAELARIHALRLRLAIDRYRAARSPAALFRGLRNTLVATALLGVAVVLVVWIWRRFDALLRRRLQARIHTVGIQSFEVVRAEKIWAALHNGMVATRTVVLAVTALLYFGYVFAQWPATRATSAHLFGMVLAPVQVLAAGFIANIPRLLFLVVLYIVVRFLLRLVRLFFEAVGRGTVTLSGFDAEWAQPTYKIVRIAIVAFGLIVAYPYIPGSESAAFKGVSLFIGIVFSLGSSTAVSNVIAGYMMTYRRAFRPGDRVKIGDSIGDVLEVRLQVTHLRSVKNEEIIIPNAQILSGEVMNYSSLARERGLLLHTEVGIGYETPWRQVEAMLLLAATRTDGLAPEPRPFVLVKRLGDFAVVYELNAPCRDASAMAVLYTALHRHILDVFNEFGVQIMTPAYEGDPEQPKLVPPQDWYSAPAQPAAAQVTARTLQT